MWPFADREGRLEFGHFRVTIGVGCSSRWCFPYAVAASAWIFSTRCGFARRLWRMVFSCDESGWRCRWAQRRVRLDQDRPRFRFRRLVQTVRRHGRRGVAHSSRWRRRPRCDAWHEGVTLQNIWRRNLHAIWRNSSLLRYVERPRTNLLNPAPFCGAYPLEGPGIAARLLSDQPRERQNNSLALQWSVNT